MQEGKRNTIKTVITSLLKDKKEQTTILLAFIIGFLASVAAYLLHWIISHIQTLLTNGLTITSYNWLLLVFPVIGIYITSLFVRYIVKDDISHGITRILYAISSKNSQLRTHNCWTSVIASAITIGFGGSVGAEAPIVLTGSAIGSNLGKFFNLDNRTLMLLVGCGASAAIAGIFKAPIAGLVFTIEVLMVDLTMSSMLPIMTASITATCFTYLFQGSSVLFTFHLDEAWNISRIPASILLGIFCGLISLYFIRMMSACEGVFRRFRNHTYGKLILGGITLSLLISLFPSLYGEGYSALDILLNGKTQADWNVILHNSLFYGQSNMLLWYIALVLITKVFATSATNGAGGVGGTFAPSLFIGGFGGFLFARLWNINELGVYVPEKNFTLLGMCGVMAGVMHAPLTGIFLIAEITGGYQLFMPLIIVAISSVLTISIFEPHSIYATRLAKEGKLITHHTDHSVLTLMSLKSIINTDYKPVTTDMQLGTLIHVISRSNSNFIPVLDPAGKLLGEVDITRLRHVIFRTELYKKMTVQQLMSPVPVTLEANDSMEDVMSKFDKTGARYLPVVDVDGILQGFASRTRLLSLYRKFVADYSAE